MRAKGIYNEGGYVLVGALLILLLLIVIGIAATTSTVMEIQIAGSDRTHKETFYAADGATQVGSELVEQSIWDFPASPLTLNASGIAPLGVALFVVSDYTQIYIKPYVDPNNLTPANRDAYFNYGVADPTGGTSVPRTDIWVGSKSVPNLGGTVPGLGSSGVPSGVVRLYEIHSKSYGNNNSESWLVVQWKHFF
jgi:hypothetical protein